MGTMTLKTAKAHVKINLKGGGEVTINWGDGKKETINLSKIQYKLWGYSYRKYYSGTGSRNITITGDNITYLGCCNNGITDMYLDNPVLEGLLCRSNKLKSLTLSNLTNLRLLSCSYNKLENLDISKNKKLENLRCTSNKLTKLDVSQNAVLVSLLCSYNELTSLSVKGYCPKLYKIYCNGNKLTKLIVDPYSKLQVLYCKYNGLSDTALNNLFESLPTYSVWQTENFLYIGGNPGATSNACKTEIAANKYWKGDFEVRKVTVLSNIPSAPLPPALANPPKPNSDEERRKQIVDGLSFGTHDPKTLLVSDYYSEKDRDRPADFIKNNLGLYIATPVKKDINNEQIYIVGDGYNNVIYPGAILIADNDLAIGKPGSLTNVKRGKVDIYGDYFSGGRTDKKDIVANNNDIHQAINSMIIEYFNNNQWSAPQNIMVDKKYYSNKKSMALEFGCDLSICGQSAKLDFKATSEEQSIVESFNCKQKFVTVRLSNKWIDDFSTLFDDKETWENIKSRSKEKPLCIVTSVTYGRDIHFVKEYTSKSWNIKSSQSANIYGQSVSSKQDIAATSEAKNTAFIAIGAGGEIAASGVDATSSDGAIQTAIKNNIKFSKTEQGNVIGYELLLLSGQYAGKSIVPVYNGFVWTTEYKRCPNTVQVDIRCNAWTLGSEKNVKVRLDAPIAKIVNGKIQYLGSKFLFEKCYDGDVSNYITSQINLGPDEYICGYMDLSIRGHACSGANWWQGHNSKIDASNGAIKLKINGTTRAGAGDLYIASDSPTRPLNS